MATICDIYEATGRVVTILYIDQPEASSPFNYKTPSKHERNRDIRMRYSLGQTVPHLAFVFQISEQRIHQILKGFDD